MLYNYRNNKGEIIPLEIEATDLILELKLFKWYKPMTWLAWSIREFTFRKANHVRNVTENNGKLMIAEAKWHFVAKPLTLESKDTRIIVLSLVDKSLVDPIAFSNAANEMMDTPYWVGGLFLQALYQITRRIAKTKKGFWIGGTGNGKVFCSMASAKLFGFSEPYKWTAEDFYKSPLFKIKYEE